MSDKTENRLIGKIQGLDDLALALLLCINASEHCIVEVPDDDLLAVEERIQVIARDLFALSSASVASSESTTLEEFSSSVLVSVGQTLNSPLREESYIRSSRHGSYESDPGLGLANVVIASNLGTTSRQVQTQALELMRTGRIFTHTNVYSAPRPFLLVSLKPSSGPRLTEHLNDFFFMSTYHSQFDSLDGRKVKDTTDSKGKAVSNDPIETTSDDDSIESDRISLEDIEALVRLQKEVSMTVDVKRYLHDVLVFLRMHRAVASGVTSRATKHFELLARCLAPCNGLSFVPPSLVALAARKVYRHRLRLVTVDEERSMQYGSDPALVAAALEGLTPDLVIDEVLDAVEIPI